MNFEADNYSLPTNGDPCKIPLEQLQISSPLTSFTHFPLLPYELRLHIWELCHPSPRNVIVAFPQNAKTRARVPDWDKQWIFPALPLSQFAHILVSHEARDCFHAHYHMIFANFPSAEEPKLEGKKAGWYFNPRKDSLCFGDGVRGLRWFMGRFPNESVWKTVRYLDVDVDRRAFHTERSVDLGYLLGKESSSLCLDEMKELRLVTMRVVVVRDQQWQPRKNHHWRPWENTGKILRQWLKGALEEGRDVKLAMQYIWTESPTLSVQSILGQDVFLRNYPGELSEDIRKRWEEVGIFLPDGGNSTHALYETERQIFCRNLEVTLQ